jgi:PHD/YefM family antitoxin component YafN of YafNO toxin-antitoxin module
MANELDQSAESRFWQAKALEVAEQIDEQWQLVMSSLRSKLNTYLISEDYYHMVREMKQVMKKYKMI